MTPPSRFDALLLQGWTHRFAACEPRLSEAVAAYEEAGFEVRLEPLPSEAGTTNHSGEPETGECRVCFEGCEDSYRVIFTRPKPLSPSPEPGTDDLFD